MGTLTFLEWLQRQLAAEERDLTEEVIEARINALSNLRLLEYLAVYQQETQ